MSTKTFETYESNVRSYCRSFGDVFYKAKNAKLYSESGQEFVDFFAGAGALNYGHNNDFIKKEIISYLMSDGISHGLDMYTKAKREFIEKFLEIVLKPKGLNYKFQFCGSTGTNAVEAALKLARKVKKRPGVFSFMGGFHGMSLGSLSATGNLQSRAGAGIPLQNVTFMPYPHGFMAKFDTIEYIETVLNDSNSGIEKPAAIILETVQAEGGVIVAPKEWMRRLSELCKRHDILLICDDIQVGCGRTGPFFSFERGGIVPDIVVLSKSISGYGLPMSMLLIKPELDLWQPGEHNGTFRGNQLAFIGAKAALEYREKYGLEEECLHKANFLHDYLTNGISSISRLISVRGIGMIWGIDFSYFGGADMTRDIVKRCYKMGLIIERVGRDDTVVKLMPPLTIEMDVLKQGVEIIKNAIMDVVSESREEFNKSQSLSVRL